MISVDHLVEVDPAWFRANAAVAEYVGSHQIDAVVLARWEPDNVEQFHHHGSVVRPFMRLHDWVTISLHLNGKALEHPNDIPNGFPMGEILAMLESHVVREELERVAPEAP